MSLMDVAREFADRDHIWSFMQQTADTQIDVGHGIILYVEGLSVSFDGFKVLDNLNLYINDGELRCIIGANGAGKTTLMDVVTGKIRPDSGHCYFGQRCNLLSMSEAQIANVGIGRKFQKPSVFECLSVWQNLELAMAASQTLFQTLFCKLNSEQTDRIAAITQRIGLSAQSSVLAGTLSHGQKQWLEIGMLLIANPRLLLLDEPVAGMTAGETELTAELLTTLAGEHSVVVIEHDMAFIRSIARKVTVLHDGRVLAEGSMEDIQHHRDVISVYLGETS